MPSMSGGSAAAAAPALAKNAAVPRRSGFGLPCIKCKTYYSADLSACPVCKSNERVTAASVPVLPAAPASPTASNEATPAPEILEAERERFLKDFNAQLLPTHPHIVGGSNCVHAADHPENAQPAVLCQACHDHLLEKIEVLESALLIDLKDATQIVYDAVWADASDPAKTYENAAQALLGELRKRSGVTPTFGLLAPTIE